MIIDNIEILSEVSAGGHAVVYKAWDPVLEKSFAIKLMRVDASENADRFLTEAKVLAQLDHQNIPRIYSYGKYENRPFLRMDFIVGRNLEEILNEKSKLPVNVAVAVVLQVAKALQYAHSLDYEIYGEKRHGIVHRDIKPANIIIDHTGSVKLIDFGIVKVDKLSIHTTSFSFIGTPSYMSPEQLDPSGEEDEPNEIDHRSDVYGLGCVLYECITGKRQFNSETISGMVTKKEKNKYDTSLLTGYSKEVQNIILKSTASEKVKRYQSVDEMVIALEKVLDSFRGGNNNTTILKYMQTGKSEIEKKARIPVPLIGIAVILVVASGLLIRGFNTISPTNLQKKISGTVSKTIDSVSTDTSQINTAVSPAEQVKNDSKPSRYLSSRTGEKISRKTVVREDNYEDTIFTKTTMQAKEKDPIEFFKNKQYQQVVNVLSLKNVDDLSDSLFLIYCGSLLTVDITKMSQIVMSRSINDGYVQYLWGRYMMSKDKWEMANGRYLLSLSKKSAISFKEDLYFNFVISSYNLYKKIPNIENREFFKARKADYLENYCNIKGVNNYNCSEVNEMLLIP